VQPLERLIQSRPMESVLAALGEDGLTLDVLEMIQAGMAVLNPDADAQDRMVYSSAFATAVERHEQRPHGAFSRVLSCWVGALYFPRCLCVWRTSGELDNLSRQPVRWHLGNARTPVRWHLDGRQDTVLFPARWGLYLAVENDEGVDELMSL
jgi:hypothetical protein